MSFDNFVHRVPGKTFSFTDHEAVEVELNVSISNQEEEKKEQFAMTEADKINATDLIKESLAATHESLAATNDQIHYIEVLQGSVSSKAIHNRL